MAKRDINWAAVDADPKFQALHRKKVGFLTVLMVISIVYYFLLPLGAAYAPDLFARKVFGPVNFGLLFALSEFIVAWGIAGIYTAKAKEFDRMAEEINREIMVKYGVQR